jgi:hypothetical protein
VNLLSTSFRRPFVPRPIVCRLRLVFSRPGKLAAEGSALGSFDRFDRQRVRFQPERTSRHVGSIPAFAPPGGFIAAAVDLAVVAAAQRDSELVADLAAECSALCKAQVVWIRGLPAAHQAGLLGNMAKVSAVTNPARLRDAHISIHCDPYVTARRDLFRSNADVVFVSYLGTDHTRELAALI